MKNIMIETSRLILREFVPEDLTGLYCLYEESDTQFLEPLSENREEELEKLKSYISVPVKFFDERLTTVSAERALIEGGVRREDRKNVIDKVAATMILQNYLAYIN